MMKLNNAKLLHGLQFLFSALVLALSTYTLDFFPIWKEVRFTVAAAGWALISLFLMAEYMCDTTNKLYLLLLEFVNWGMFLAIWIALAQNIASATSFCRVGDHGPHSFIKPCQTIYAALACAIFAWLLFSWSFGGSVWAIICAKKEPRSEKEAAQHA